MLVESLKTKRFWFIIAVLLLGLVFLLVNNNVFKKSEFGSSIIMSINSKVTFSDGLVLNLKEINDSRCKPNVQCIWQGELSPVFIVKIGNSLEEIRLGTVNNREVNLNKYIFSLKEATESNAIIVVLSK